MSGTINKVILIGSLGKDPEIRMTQGGGQVASFSIATSESWNDKATGEKKEVTEWHKISAFGTQAAIIEKYVKKGSKLFVEGKLTTRKWKDKDGQDRYSTEIKLDNFTMLDSKNATRSDEVGAAAPASTKPVSAEPAFDDEIPF